MFLHRLLRTRTTPRSEPAAAAGGAGWWQPFLTAGYAREAGETEPTTPEESLCYHAWYRAISLIASKCASVPRHLLAPDGAGKRRDLTHPVYSTVNGRVNEEQTAFQFWLQMGGHVPSRGNGYAAIYRDRDNTELLPLDPDWTYPMRKDGVLWYVAFPFGYEGDGIRILPRDILHFRGFGFDGLVGYPVWKKAAEEVGLGRAQRRLEKSRYANDGRPSLMLMTEQRLDDKARNRLMEDWTKMHVGVDKRFRTAILDAGLKAEPVSMDAEELGQDGALQMSLVAIANYTGVPPSKLGANKTYASQEQEDGAFVSDCLDFWLSVFDDESSAKLLTDQERKDGYEVKANREALMRATRKDKFETLLKATAGKPFMTQNEARRQIDLPASPEEDADKLLVPLNMGQGGFDNQPDNPADPGPGRPTDTSRSAYTPSAAVRRGVRRVIEYTAARLVRRAAAQANRAAAKPEEFLAWVDSFRQKEAAAFAGELHEVRNLAAATKPSIITAPTDGVAAFLLDGIHGRYDRLAQSTSANKLAEAVAVEARHQEGALPAAIANFLLGETP